MNQISRTFRDFVSSTFSDLKPEQNAIQEWVFPYVRVCVNNRELTFNRSTI
jgi:hypothetical protein